MTGKLSQVSLWGPLSQACFGLAQPGGKVVDVVKEFSAPIFGANPIQRLRRPRIFPVPGMQKCPRPNVLELPTSLVLRTKNENNYCALCFYLPIISLPCPPLSEKRHLISGLFRGDFSKMKIETKNKNEYTHFHFLSTKSINFFQSSGNSY